MLLGQTVETVRLVLWKIMIGPLSSSMTLARRRCLRRYSILDQTFQLNANGCRFESRYQKKWLMKRSFLRSTPHLRYPSLMETEYQKTHQLDDMEPTWRYEADKALRVVSPYLSEVETQVSPSEVQRW